MPISSCRSVQGTSTSIRPAESSAMAAFTRTARPASAPARRVSIMGAPPPTVTPSPDEVAEVFETPWDFLMDAANHRRDFYDMDEGLRRWFWAMPWGERYIWGVTAGILKGLHARLYGDEAHPAAAADEDAA